MIRQPIISVLGHVDHGKTTLLDRIRNTALANKEAGGITQHIGASEVPLDIIEKIAGPLMHRFGAKMVIPGLLFIDTPGHEAFTNLRKRGGSVADLAILVVDVSKSFEPQTYEAIDILKEYKTPFIVAANKIDLITGWLPKNTSSFSESIAQQNPNVVNDVEAKMYELVGKLSEIGFNSERFDRITDFQRELAIFPVSAKTGEGVAELLVYATGLAQKFLGPRLDINTTEPGKGSILEKKEEKGLGTTIDVILYSGTLNVNDTVAFATPSGIGTAKVKALLKPKSGQDMRDSSTKYSYLDYVAAASGVKIAGSGLEDALPGSLVMSTRSATYTEEIKTEIQEAFATEKIGVILKVDSIGSLEAISRLLQNMNVHVSKKGLGDVTKRDILDAFAMKANDPYNSVVLSFNVNIAYDAEAESVAAGIKVINENVIYKILDDYKEWLDQAKKMEKEQAERALTFPGVIKVLPNTFFRVSHPAVFGVDVVAGRVKPSYLMVDDEGKKVGRVVGIQENAVALPEAKAGESVAISIDDGVCGRNIKEHMLLYTMVDDQSEMMLRSKFKHLLINNELELLDKIAELKKKMIERQ
ncbi:MAG: translation initiation factor IF-2 [Candidatus Micrarchaeota archaeon]|nr:translation initiation factor IF-2 [Candidatus Micrarchaeota archaeon]MDE1804935.1 translation initiation factor IF-2 [Candidatus Micrarchaeota archaeon]MDE1847138.1 translation initiation factor IF-2 [Candidatus Micrarchaeota archaeon]